MARNDIAFEKFTKLYSDFLKKETPLQALRVQRTIALQLLSAFVLRTPVKTGRARGNWQVTIDNPASGEVKDAEKKSAQQVIGEGSAVIANANFLAPSIWFSNNLPYILALDNGSSSQAPTGIVDVALINIASQFA